MDNETEARPSQARLWHYLQGGDDYRQVDRDAAGELLAVYPDAFYHAQQCRLFLERAVRSVALEAGIRQFLDLGCGLPAPKGHLNVHEIVPAKVVYVDDDRWAVERFGVLLDQPDLAGRCAFIEADARHIDSILDRAATRLDFDQPVGVILFGILASMGHDDARRVLGRVVEAIPAGSCLAFCDSADLSGQAEFDTVEHGSGSGEEGYQLRTVQQLRDYFTGLDMIDPGLVTVTAWRPDAAAGELLRPVRAFGCVVRKP